MSFKDIKLIGVGILIFDDVDFLDVVGPLEVFHATRIEERKTSSDTQISDLYDSISLFNTKLVSVYKEEMIRTANGSKLIPDLCLEDLQDSNNSFNPFIWVVPGGKGIHTIRKDNQFIDWLSNTIEVSHLILSVCTGTYAVAQTGHLDIEPATTHWRHLNLFAKEFPHITLDVNARYVETPKIITTGGVSCGIDGALRVVARLVSEDAAQRVTEAIVYPWLS
ncbi:MAG: DJ-1/PfpI family protein [Candidatus Kariarchaeaceae archaeon]|jgi:transcriptional regulator GlxA family with amidase domain